MEREKRNSNSETEWERMGVRVLQAVKQDLYLSMRYLYLILEKMPLRADQRMNWMGTDGTYLYYQPMRMVEAWKQDEVTVNRAYLHSVLHGMFGHMYRRGEREVALWNLAADIAVEFMIDGLTFRAVRRLIPERRERIYHLLTEQTRVMSAERIYEVLEQPAWEHEIPLMEEWFLVDDHGFWRETPDEERSSQQRDQEKQEQELWRELRERVQTEMETYARTAGMERTRLYQELTRENRERTDYREFLQRFARLREEMKLDLDSFDYGYYQYGMQLYGNMPLIEELEYREDRGIQEFAIVIDTSGSCSKELVSHFLEETVSILEDAIGAGSQGASGGSAGTHGGRMRCHIIQCDDQIQEVVTVESADELRQYLDQMQIIGRGGTDYRPAFAYAREQKRTGQWKELQGLLYFTDGYGVYPETRPEFEAGFLFPEDIWPDGKPPWQSEAFPVWAMHLEIKNQRRKQGDRS